MSIIFQCSLNKANWQKEKAILVKAALMTEWQDNCWARYRKNYYSYQWLFTAENSYTNSLNVIVTARQLASIVILHKLNPNLTDRDLLKTLKLNARNKFALKYSSYKDLVD